MEVVESISCVCFQGYIIKLTVAEAERKLLMRKTELNANYNSIHLKPLIGTNFLLKTQAKGLPGFHHHLTSFLTSLVSSKG